MEDQIPNLYLATADFYDSDNQELGTADIDFYLSFAIDFHGPVLDLCCGTGRVTVPFALNGVEVTAVDFSKSMLEVLNHKLPQIDSVARSRIKASHGDMRNLSLGKTYELIIIALRSFQVLRTDFEVSETLAGIHRHLAPAGFVIIDLFKPLEDMKTLEGLSEEKIVKSADGEVLYTRRGINTQIDTLQQMLYCNFEYIIENNINEDKIFKERLKIKYYYEQQFREILERNNFKVVECYGGFDYCASDASNATELIFVCQANLASN